jgi:hypothetical protein
MNTSPDHHLSFLDRDAASMVCLKVDNIGHLNDVAKAEEIENPFTSVYLGDMGIWVYQRACQW